MSGELLSALQTGGGGQTCLSRMVSCVPAPRQRERRRAADDPNAASYGDVGFRKVASEARVRSGGGVTARMARVRSGGRNARCICAPNCVLARAHARSATSLPMAAGHGETGNLDSMRFCTTRSRMQWSSAAGCASRRARWRRTRLAGRRTGPPQAGVRRARRRGAGEDGRGGGGAAERGGRRRSEGMCAGARKPGKRREGEKVRTPRMPRCEGKGNVAEREEKKNEKKKPKGARGSKNDIPHRGRERENVQFG